MAAYWPHLVGLQLVDPYFYSNDPIDLLLGVDFYQYIVEETIIKGPPGAPVATLTSLGWLLLCSSGNNNDVSQDTSNHISIESCSIDFQESNTDVKEKELCSVVTDFRDPQITLAPEHCVQEADTPVKGEESGLFANDASAPPVALAVEHCIDPSYTL